MLWRWTAKGSNLVLGAEAAAMSLRLMNGDTARRNILGKHNSTWRDPDYKKPGKTEGRGRKGQVAEGNLKKLSSLLVKGLELDATWEVTEDFCCRETIRFAFSEEASDDGVERRPKKLKLEAENKEAAATVFQEPALVAWTVEGVSGCREVGHSKSYRDVGQNKRGLARGWMW